MTNILVLLSLLLSELAEENEILRQKVRQLQQQNSIRRGSREAAKRLLVANPQWNVLDIGCGGYESILTKHANVLADLEDQSAAFPGRRFVQTNAEHTPFRDQEFDFVIASHVMEHVENPFQLIWS